MAIKRRKNKLQDLAASGIVTNRVSGSIPFEYSGPNSPLFTISEVPNPVPQGKSSFLISGTELLKNSVEVKIEIIDSEGGVVYTEPVANYLEGNARRVSIEVYDDTPPGPANLYILAQVDPEEWEDETGTDVTNFPSPQPLRVRGKRRKKRRRDREKRKQMRGMPQFDLFARGGASSFFINPNFRPPPQDETRFRRRRGRRRRGQTADISDQYNFLQKVEMQIVPTATNTEKILFYQEPRLRVSEVFKPFVANIAPSASAKEVGQNLVGSVIQDTQGSAAASSLDSFGAALNTFRRKRKFRKFAGKGGLMKRKRITRRASPEVDNYSFSSTTFTFTSEHVGGSMDLIDVAVNTTNFPPSRYTAPTTASFEIRKVKNSSTIIPDSPYKVYDNQLAQFVDAPITYASFSIEYPNPVTQSISITNFRSYADVRVSNIRTFSGDVFRTKIYRKSEESISDYELFADLPLESSELLLNTLEGTGLERTGYFVGQEDLNKYWEVSQSAAGVTGALSASIMAYDIDKQMDSVHISGSNYGSSQFVTFTLNKSYSFTLEKDVDYDFSAEIYGIASPKFVPQESGPEVEKTIAEMEVFISGSNIPAQQGNELFGAKIGALRINDGSIEKDFGVTTGDFESTSKSENCIITFKVNAGQFYLSDISIRPATETGFSPDLFTFQAPMPSNEIRPETYEFLAEFYDVNNNQADAFTFTPSGSEFKGSNMVITGEDNVLESNLFIGGESTASGMHLGGVSSVLPETNTAGAAGSGFMRSVGYTGFTSASEDALDGKPGFMIYSGSVLPDSGDNYDGVGLELIGKSGSLRFSTNPSRFEVEADAFFVGRQDIQFISGAAGNIEISSSNFHLSRSGDVIMAGTITAEAGNIGGFTITPDAIASPDKSLIMSGSGEITGSQVLFTGGKIASFELSDDAFTAGDTFFISSSVTTDNGFFISSSNFNVKASGDITGSQVLFTGGKIASFELSDNAFTAGHSFFISSSVENDNSFFISSSKFNVKAGGDVSGSSVLFDGGTIAGWTIGPDTLTGGNLILSKDGSIRSSNYVSDFSGWSITAEDNGFAEFENVKIRGTLSTTTFEKESVNAVGGQLFVANSTALTGSAVLAADTTMSVVNASGFAHGEVLIAKKVTNTGFTTEYIKVDSASLDGDLTKDELYGRIYVTRSISTDSRDSGSVGDPIGAAQDYEPGQVLASTGKIGTGYIRINANPNNDATPYIDIVERTGSGPYDVELKARLGDLSGVGGSRNVPLGFTGFGLMSEVAFLSGSNIKLEAPSFLLGDKNSSFVSGSNAKIEVSASNFHLQPDGQLLFGDKPNSQYIEWNNSSLIVRGDLTVDNIQTPSTIGGSPSTLSNASASITSQGFAKFTSASIAGFDISPSQITKNDITLDSANRLIDVGGDADFRVRLKENSGEPFISIGNPTDTFGDKGIFFQAKDSAGDTRVNFSVQSDTAAFGDAAGAIKLNTNGILEINSTNFKVKADGSVTASSMQVDGDINADTGTFRDVKVAGTLVANASGSGTLNLVETWAPIATINSGGGSAVVFDKTDLGNTVWGWTASAGVDSGNIFTAADPDDGTPKMTPASDTGLGDAADPPPSFFQGVNHIEGKDGDRATRNAFYEIPYSNYTSGPFAGNGGIPKLGIADTAGPGASLYIETQNLHIPLTQTDLFECFLEFASRDAGNFGGFRHDVTVTVYKRDGTTLYTEQKTHQGAPSAWTTWSIPLVASCGLVTEANPNAPGDDAFVLITQLKLRLEWENSGAGGGGTMDGIVFTELRLRRAPYQPYTSTNVVSAAELVPAPASSQVKISGDGLKMNSETADIRGYSTGISTDTTDILKINRITAKEYVRSGGTSSDDTNTGMFLENDKITLQAGGLNSKIIIDDTIDIAGLSNRAGIRFGLPYDLNVGFVSDGSNGGMDFDATSGLLYTNNIHDILNFNADVTPGSAGDGAGTAESFTLKPQEIAYSESGDLGQYASGTGVYTFLADGRYLVNIHLDFRNLPNATDYIWLHAVTSHKTFYGPIFRLDDIASGASGDIDYFSYDTSFVVPAAANETMTCKISVKNADQDYYINGSGSDYRSWIIVTRL